MSTCYSLLTHPAKKTHFTRPLPQFNQEALELEGGLFGNDTLVDWSEENDVEGYRCVFQSYQSFPKIL